MAKNPYGTLDIEYRCELLGGEQGLRRAIMKELNAQMSGFNVGTSGIIQNRARAILKTKLESSDTYQSLLGNGLSSLRGHFGIEDVSSIPLIVDVITGMLTVTEGPVKNKKGGFEIKLSVYLDVVDVLDELKLVKLGIQQTKKGKDLNWIEWLLVRGNEIIIDEYQILFSSNRFQGWSRTGEAIMAKGANQRWSVPTLHSGTINDNWVTKAIAQMSTELIAIIEQEYARAASRP